MSHSPFVQAAQRWLAKDIQPASQQTLRELIETNDEAALEQAFAARLSFGTAGLRGLMGVGPGNMNRLVIRETTAGLAKHLLASNPDATSQGVVIAYDGRFGSKDFAADAAGVLAANGIAVQLYDREAPTPLCAFAVRTRNAAAGIVITASHNPPKYNGYKVYWRGGGQINDPIDGHIAAAIDEVAASDIAPACLTLSESKERGLLTYLGTSTFETYISSVLSHFNVTKSSAHQDLRIAYTPLHGVGAPLAESLLERAGFTNFHTVKSQREPDGAFPTVAFPNPEEKGAMDALLALAEEHQSHIALANDPDADRLAIAARDGSGKMRQFTGDQLGALLGDELMQRAKKEKEDLSSSWTLSTIVSSRLLARLARTFYGAQHQETLTGFKWLGNAARSITERKETFLFAYEEALGYLVSPLVWDKDGLSALILISTLAACLHASNQTLWDRLEEIHGQSGLSVTAARTVPLKAGMSGAKIMDRLRADISTAGEHGEQMIIAGRKVALVDDLAKNPQYPPEGSKQIPKNDVLRFYFEQDGGAGRDAGTEEGREAIMLSAPRIIVRPSGTEPKVKIYAELLGSVDADRKETYTQATKRLEEELVQLVDGFFAWVRD